MTREYRHTPVMLDEVLSTLQPQAGEIVCDCTLGGAGHSVELAQRVGSQGLLIGIDQDEMARTAAAERLNREAPGVECHILAGNFAQLDELLVEDEIAGVDCFLFDLGVSSPQLDIPERGFSYKYEAPLDMRMNPGKQTLTAAEVINTYNEADLTRILRSYGDEKHAKRIAHEICRARAQAPIETTTRLAELVVAAIPAADRRHGHHPARKSFQALRIEVNAELEVLREGLTAALRWLEPGGRICVISYHSLEDKVVKSLFGEHSRGCICPPDLPVCVCGRVPTLELITKRPLLSTEQELEYNPRARSAKLRAARKLAANTNGFK
ncbi:MAG: 16S rRNA (cytosine(1402)-N(4))-methyltransferase RsmH [Atopobiaceae bacterium]|nr:16S rRNA (cytosine(1402)-N(4))-methyltransferase RsmH [Atopobiaceae bacterium]